MHPSLFLSSQFSKYTKKWKFSERKKSAWHYRNIFKIPITLFFLVLHLLPCSTSYLNVFTESSLSWATSPPFSEPFLKIVTCNKLLTRSKNRNFVPSNIRNIEIIWNWLWNVYWKVSQMRVFLTRNYLRAFFLVWTYSRRFFSWVWEYKSRVECTVITWPIAPVVVHRDIAVVQTVN